MINRIKLQGSLTVEAAFVIPILFSGIVVLFYMGFLMHDKAAAGAKAYEKSLLLANYIYAGGDKSTAANPDMVWGDHNLLIAKGLQTAVLEEKKSVEVTITAAGNIGKTPLAAMLIDTREFMLEEKGYAEIEEALPFVWKYRKLTEKK